jgi:hypothetical protein
MDYRKPLAQMLHPTNSSQINQDLKFWLSHLLFSGVLQRSKKYQDNILISSKVHPTSYSMGSSASFPGG